MTRIREFFAVYRMYRRFHPAPYALARAWGITFQSLPF